MNNILKSFRHKVSADKNRYQAGEYDLDLTYVSDRLIAMAFPAEGVESTYRNNIDQVSRLLKQNHDNSFILYNLSNRPYDDSKFDGRVYNWCGFMDHYPPPLSLLWRILLSIHTWLLADDRNVCVIHCLAGKGRTGTIIALYMVFCGLFQTVLEALNFFAYRRSHNVWGVTGPSQIRYCEYAEKIIKTGYIPKSEPIVLTSITLTNLPRLQIGPGEKGCTPFFEIYSYDQSKHLLFSSEQFGQEIRSFPCSKKQASLYIDCPLRGDILIQFKHVTPLYGTEPMFHVCFHTGMIENYQLVIPRSGVEKGFKDPRFPDNFTLTLTFQPLKDSMQFPVNKQDIEEEQRLWAKRPDPDLPLDGRICFIGNVELKMASARDIGCPTRGNMCVKGGWLTKQGHKVKNWKRRWFVLKNNALSYYKAPRDAKAVGVIPVSLIQNVEYIEGAIDEYYNVFLLSTEKNSYLISGGTDQERREWGEAILYARSLQLIQGPSQANKVGTLVLKVEAAGGVRYEGELCASFMLESQKYTATAVPKAQTPASAPGAPPIIHFNDNIAFIINNFDALLVIYLWDSGWKQQEDEKILGKTTIPVNFVVHSGRVEDWFSLNPADSNDNVFKMITASTQRTFSNHQVPIRSPYGPSASIPVAHINSEKSSVELPALSGAVGSLTDLTKISDIITDSASPKDSSASDKDKDTTWLPATSHSSEVKRNTSSGVESSSNASKIGVKKTQMKKSEIEFVPRIRLVLEFIPALEETDANGSGFLSGQLTNIRNLLVEAPDSSSISKLSKQDDHIHRSDSHLAPPPATQRSNRYRVASNVVDQRMHLSKISSSFVEEPPGNKNVWLSLSTSAGDIAYQPRFLEEKPSPANDARPLSWDDNRDRHVLVDYKSSKPPGEPPTQPLLEPSYPAPPVNPAPPIPTLQIVDSANCLVDTVPVPATSLHQFSVPSLPENHRPAPPPPLKTILDLQKSLPNYIPKFVVTDAACQTLVVANEKLMWVADSVGDIWIFNVQIEHPMLTIRKTKTSGSINSLALVGDMIWSAGDTGITIWNKLKYKPVRKLKRHKGTVTCLLYTREPEHVWSGSSDENGSKGSLLIWDPNTFECKKQIELGNGHVSCIADHRQTVWVGTRDFVLSFDMKTLELQKQINVGIGDVNNVVGFHQNLWISSKESAKIFIWNYETGCLLEEKCEHTSNLVGLERTTQFIWSASVVGEIFIWDGETRQIVERKSVCNIKDVAITCLKLGGERMVLCGDSNGVISLYRKC